MPAASACYHCGNAVPANAPWYITLGGTKYPLCCPGCEAVAHAIVEGGLESYYLQRTELPAGPANDVLNVAAWAHFDHPDRQRDFLVHRGETGQASTTLAVEGITCNACAWLIEHRLNALDGLVSSAVDLSHHRLTVSWRPAELRLSRLLAELAAIGYRALPFTPDPALERLQKKQRHAVRRFAIASASLGCLGLVALYRHMHELEASVSQADTLLAWLSLTLATIVMLTATPFLHQTLGDLKLGRLGPMLPTVITLLGAYLVSLHGMFEDAGESYAGFIALLVTFLLLGRAIELRYALKEARRSRLPASATRLNDDKGARRSERILPVGELSVGDLIVVKAGQYLPADGTIVQGESSLDESRLTGEQLPVTRKAGDHVLCGCKNLENSLIIKVTQASPHTRIERIDAQVKAAWRTKRLTELDAHKIHGWVACVLLITAAVAIIEWRPDPLQALDRILAMLVAGSPFALALATPAALVAAYRRLRRRGVVAARPGILLSLAQAPNTDSATCSEVIVLSLRSGRREDACRIAHLAKRCTGQNRCVALGMSLVLLPLAALGYLPPWGAVVGAAAGTLAVIGNTQRLLGLPLFPKGSL